MNAIDLQPGLRDERIALRQELAEAEAIIAEYKRQEVRRSALGKVRDAIWGATGKEWVETVLKTARQVLRDMDIPFDSCGINWIDGEADPPTVWFRSLDGTGGGMGSQIQSDNPGVELILRFWREQKIAYRPDLETYDPYGELERIRIKRPIRSVLDVPFAHGTLAMSSIRPRAFSSEDILFLEEMARLLSEFAQRRRDFAALEERNWELETEIAERRRIERDLEQTRDALEEQVATRTAALVQAQKMEAIGRLTAGIAHNFNNLLQGTLGNLFLAANTAPEDIKHLLDDAAEPMHRAAEMIHQLMLFARAGKAPDHGSVDLRPILDQVAAICRRTFDRKIEFELQVPARLPAVWGDANQLQQVLLNLLLNARDAVASGNPETWAISLCVELVDGPRPTAAGPHLRIRVTDNGVGMDERTRQQIFEPFFTTKAVGVGTGLGLATAYAIVDQHRGWMHCRSAPGRGSTFALYLPATTAVAASTATNGSPPPEAKGETILVVDDNEMVRQSTRQALSGFGYRVIEAEDGPKALEILRHIGSTVDLVLLDWSMPKMSGGEVLQQLRLENPALKVVIFTGHDQVDLAHAEGFIQKPFTPCQIHRKVRQVLDYQSRR